MPQETFVAARTRILSALTEHGWTVRSNLKTPWAEPHGGGYRLWFKAQAVYLDQHSLWIDIRGMSTADFLAHVQRGLTVRSRYGSRR